MIMVFPRIPKNIVWNREVLYFGGDPSSQDWRSGGWDRDEGTARGQVCCWSPCKALAWAHFHTGASCHPQEASQACVSLLTPTATSVWCACSWHYSDPPMLFINSIVTVLQRLGWPLPQRKYFTVLWATVLTAVGSALTVGTCHLSSLLCPAGFPHPQPGGCGIRWPSLLGSETGWVDFLPVPCDQSVPNTKKCLGGLPEIQTFSSFAFPLCSVGYRWGDSGNSVGL